MCIVEYSMVFSWYFGSIKNIYLCDLNATPSTHYTQFIVDVIVEALRGLSARALVKSK